MENWHPSVRIEGGGGVNSGRCGVQGRWMWFAKLSEVWHT